MKANIFMCDIFAGILEELPEGKFRFSYEKNYTGLPVSLTMPLNNTIYNYDKFPPFFEGLLPEGALLNSLLRKYKIDRDDYFKLLLQVGSDVIGAVTIEEVNETLSH
jgi:serine/threonine-protein kinase HipA